MRTFIPHTFENNPFINLKTNTMKASIHIDGKEIWASKQISAKNLEKKEQEIKRQYGVTKMEERVKRGFHVFTSKD